MRKRKKMCLEGYLDKEGIFHRSDIWGFACVAKDLCLIESYGNFHSYDYEKTNALLLKNGFVKFQEKTVTFNFEENKQGLTLLQKAFLLNHLKDANTEEQYACMRKIIEKDDAIREKLWQTKEQANA